VDGLWMAGANSGLRGRGVHGVLRFGLRQSRGRSGEPAGRHRGSPPPRGSIRGRSVRSRNAASKTCR